MTAEVPKLDWALLKRITARVTAEVPGICRVCYDLTPKPVGSVEWGIAGTATWALDGDVTSRVIIDC